LEENSDLKNLLQRTFMHILLVFILDFAQCLHQQSYPSSCAVLDTMKLVYNFSWSNLNRFCKNIWLLERIFVLLWNSYFSATHTESKLSVDYISQTCTKLARWRKICPLLGWQV